MSVAKDKSSEYQLTIVNENYTGWTKPKTTKNGSNYVTSQKPSVYVISENENEEDAEKDEISQASSSTRTSFNRNSRQASKTSAGASRKISSNQNQRANRTNLNSNLSSSQNTTDSSLRGSVGSLPVIREQYCCSKRWTRMEKRLLKAVGILAIIIIILVIAVGILAKRRNREGDRNNFFWSF